MFNGLLYLITTFIWGSTWLAIQYQLGSVDPLWSVAYRFFLAALCLFFYCFATSRSIRFDSKQHMGIALQGLLMFCLNYILFYLGSQYFISGLVSLIFASMIVMNIINSRIFLQTPLVKRILCGAVLGISGLVIVFGSQLSALHLAHLPAKQIFIGLALCLAATLSASLGNIVSVKNQRLKLPVLESSVWGMFYGAVFTALLAILSGRHPTFIWTFKYVGSLLYLSFAGTIIAFLAYLNLLRRIGPERAAYTFVLLPVISLSISTWIEGFQWNLPAFVGMILVLWGNYLVLTKTKSKSSITSNDLVSE